MRKPTASPRSARGVADRRADLAQIHIGKKALGWDDEFYRSILWTICRVKSSAELDMAGRLRLIDHMRKCGWASQTDSRAQRPVSAPLSPVQRKMWALWQQLADAGLVDNRRMPALLAWVKRQTGVDRLEWLNGKQEDLVVESLKAWLASRGAA